MSKKTAIVVCPGRGTYNKAELGYIAAQLADKRLLQNFDSLRQQRSLPTITELDQAAVFNRSIHLQADNAAGLIFAAGINDYQSIDLQQFDVVAITGNSMGWYTALGCAGVLTPERGMQLVTDMAQLTAGGRGAQFIYPLVDENWQPDPQRKALVQQQLNQSNNELFMSIVYGGYAVLAGTDSAVKAAMAALPACDDRFPLLLPGHAGFHTSLMQTAADQALTLWPPAKFSPPQLPLVDGRGQIWPAHGANLNTLQHYTLQQQVCQKYDFNLALQVAVKEFSPEHIILLGPGSSMGGAVAQALIQLQWRGLTSKQDFSAAQLQTVPYILSMGIAEQRRHCSAAG